MFETTSPSISAANRRFRLGVMIAAVGLLAAAGASVISLILWEPRSTSFTAWLLQTTSASLVLLILLYGNASLIFQGRTRVLGLIGVLLTTATWLLTLGVLTFEDWTRGDDTVGLLLATFWIVTLGLTLGSYVWTVPLAGTVANVYRWCVFGLIALETSLLLSIVWEALPLASGRFGGPTPLAIFAVGPGVMLSLASVLCVNVVNRFQTRRAKRKADSFSADVKLRLKCPSCAAEQLAPIGRIQCVSCGTVMTVEIEEPRCVCGYLLFNLRGAVCPECGRPVPETQRWRGDGASAEGGSGLQQAPMMGAKRAPVSSAHEDVEEA